MQFFKQRSRNVAQLVGTVLVGSVVEALAPNEIHRNRFRLRCECGAEFHALTQQIHNCKRHGSRLTCADCSAPKVELHDNVTRLPSKRCAHGFLGGVDCQECNPDEMCCPVCGTVGHEMKLCPNTETGRRRIVKLRNLKKAAYESERYRSGKKTRRQDACQSRGDS